MNRSAWILVAAIYAPLSAVLLARIANRSRPRQFVSCLLSTLWVTATLPLLARLNFWAGWWSFHAMQPTLAFGSIPLALYIGWILLWGPLPTMMFPRMRLPWVVAILACADLCSMPALQPVVALNERWLIGEAAAIGIVLLPGQRYGSRAGRSMTPTSMAGPSFRSSWLACSFSFFFLS